MKIDIKKIIHSKASKRIASGLTAIVMLTSMFTVDVGKDGESIFDFGVINASADDILFPHDATTKIVTIEFSQLVDYSVDCENHREYHKDDNLIISGSGQTVYFKSGFKGLGSSSWPFEGSVKITASGAGDKVMNLDGPLFNYVYDDVEIWNEYGANHGLNISRTYSPGSLVGDNAISKRTPLLADHVIHRNDGTARTWNVNVTTPSTGTYTTLQSFGGIIGTMEYDSEHDVGASLTVNIFMDKTEDDTAGIYDTAAIDVMGQGNMGFACGTMQEKTYLDFTLSSNRGVGEISTNSGHVGSLVGEMKAGSEFTYAGSNPQTVTTDSKDIKTTGAGGYAGGIVGKNVGGTVTFTGYSSSNPYPIGQIIEGKSGAGSIYGYYEPAGTDDVNIYTSNFAVSATLTDESGSRTYNCQVNGSGNVGGLIGELVCTNNVTISGSQGVSTSHASTKASCYGGLVGKYTNDASHKLTVGSLSITTANGGGSDYYGGCIGIIDDAAASYAAFNAPTVTSSNAGALTYGGLVASADNAFIDVNGATVTASDFKGGGIVGSLDHGILRLDGTVNLKKATPATPDKNKDTDETDYVGKVVGWRDDALVFAKSTCALTTSDDTVDDIGSWGQVIRFTAEASEDVEASEGSAAYTKSIEKLGGTEVLSVNESTHAVTIAAPSDSTNTYKKIASVSDYAKTALCFQIDASKNSFLSFANTSYTYNNIGAQNISLAANVNLTNTGLVNLTRDNDIGTVSEGTRSYNGDKCVYSGTFDGMPDSTQYTITYGGSAVYRHSYTGLFGITNNATIQETTFEGSLNVNAKEATVYTGSAAGTAKGTFSASDLVVNTTINHAGGSTLYVGGVLGEASSSIGNITVSDITANATIAGSASDTCLGGVIGKISHNTITASPTWSFSDIDISGTIRNTASLDKNQVGGLVAVISGNSGTTSRTLDLNAITVKDLDISVNSNSDGSVGGLLGYSWASVNTNFDGVQIGIISTDDSTVPPTTTITTPTITQTNNSASGVDFAGVVYQGTGHWTLTGADDLKINAFKLNSDAAQSFGMIVNKGWAGNSDNTAIASAIYLDIQNASAYSILADNVSFIKCTPDETEESGEEEESEETELTYRNTTIPIFDELVAHTAFYTGSGAGKVHYSGDEDNLYIIQNGQAVVSIETGEENGGLKMGKYPDDVEEGEEQTYTLAASGTYTPATTYGQQMNPCSRYYYNLHTLKDSSSGAGGLMSWGAKWYAHSSIENDVSSNSWGSTIPNGTYDLQGYSWYPVNIDSATVNINGTFKLYNREFEASETAAETADSNHAARTSLLCEDGTTTQHYLLHSALFNNVNGKLNVGTATLQGSVPLIDTRTYEEVEKELEGGETETETVQTGGSLYSGALVRGSVTGSGATESATAKVTTTSVILDGVYVYNFNLATDDYAPLLINKSGSYSSLTINGVKVNADSSYKSNSNLFASDGETLRKVDGYPKIATSLIGNAGVDENSKNVNVNFTNIRLDGREGRMTGTGMSDLDTAYHTQVSLFTQATLLNKLTFDTGKGTYTFKQSDDWTVTSEEGATPVTHSHNVTYGKELGYENKTNPVINQYGGEELWYLDTNPGTYVDPTTSSGDGSYASTFRADGNYLPYVATAYDSSKSYFQLEVNHSSPTFSGCGTYNDPYIITSGTDFNTIYSILNSQGDPGIGTAKIYIPLKKANKVGDVQYYQADLAATWHNSTYGHEAFIYKAQKSITVGETTTNYDAGYYKYVDGTDNDYVKNTVSGSTTYKDHYLTTIEMRTYVAGAYYKLKPANNEDGTTSTNITISGNTFKGLGNTTDSYAQFRGVIVGTGNETIINKSGYPLIAYSNGSVVKDINITVDMSSDSSATGDISRTMDSAKTYDATGGGANYGGVIGSVLGGDNIIDDVTVTFQNTTITLSDDAAQLIPVGGYVGVVLNGGVIFRGMEGKSSGIDGLPANGTVVRYNDGTAVTETNLIKKLKTGSTTVYEDNMRWLYVNPIIGRVINGYAVTEASAYRPYEDGTRTYKGGIEDEIKYWDEIKQKEVDEKPATLSCVTMKNGNKHYSITDIDITADKLDFGPTSNTNATKDKSKPLVPNGQAFFLMSVMVDSGMARNTLGYNQVYQVSRWAQYDDVDTNTTAPEPTTACDYYTYAKLDRVDSTNGTVANRKTKQVSGYLANFYTESATLARVMTDASTTLTLSTANGKYYLPDGYKGIGNMYATSNPGYYRLSITNFDGNGATVSMNSSWYYYFNDAGNDGDLTEFDTIYHHHSHIGFGLFNYQSGATTSDSSKYYNFILTGNVVTDCINSSSDTGAHITYRGARSNTGFDQSNNVSVDGDYMVSAGGLIGATSTSQYLDRVALQNIYIHGVRYSGGLIGLDAASKNEPFTYKNTPINNATIQSNEIKVRGASTCGGMVGKIQNAPVSIDNGNATYSITEVVSECSNMAGSDFNYGVGGFIGACRTDSTVADSKAITIRNVIVGSKNQSSPSVIKAENADIFAGGLVGILNKGTLTLSDCTIYNQTVSTPYIAGGLCGHYASATGTANVSNVTIYAKDYKTATTGIENPKITSTNKAAGGFFGSIKDEFNSGEINIFNSEISGYTISVTSDTYDCYSGGAIGLFGQNAAGTNLDIIWNLYNTKIADCNISASSTAEGKIGYSGGIVGGMGDYETNGNLRSGKDKYLYGYNILTKNLNITGNIRGGVCGKRINTTDCLIKLAGFSRQGTITTTNLIGSPREGKTYQQTRSFYYETDSSGNIVGDMKGASDYSEWSEITYDSSIGDTPLTTYSGTEVKYVTDTNANAQKLSDLAKTRASYGFYIYYGDGTGNTYWNNKLKSGSNGVIEEVASTKAGIWFFEACTVSNPSDGHVYYKIHNGDGEYVCTDSDSDNKLKLGASSNADVFAVYANNNETKFYLRKYDTSNNQEVNKWLQHSTGGGGIRYYTDANNATNSKFTFKYVSASFSELEPSYYSSLSISGGVVSHTVTATNSDMTDYVTAYNTYCTADPENNWLYYITETVKKNETTEDFGTDSYIIFADYNDNASSDDYQSPDFSNVNTGATDVTTRRSKTTVTVETYEGGEKKKTETNVTYGEYKLTIPEPTETYSEGYEPGVSTDYTKTTTVVENENYPFVTTSKSTDIDGTQFLTGDGLSSTSFGSSNFTKINNDSVATGEDAVAKAYKIYGRYDSTTHKVTANALNAEDIAYISERYSSSHGIYGDVSGMVNFPILVVDDTDRDKTTEMINNYINALANTSYNYAESSAESSSVYKVSLHKCTWDTTDASNPKWSVNISDTSANLLTEFDGSNYYFTFDPDHVDTGATPTFSLIDIQYYDPSSGGTKIAYHLYIPVYVNQLLRFKFDAALASNTDYYDDAYSEKIDYLFENLGNPVTMRFEYEYIRTPSAWAQNVNEGGNVLSNYYKSLYLENTNCFPTETKLVLVDTNNKDKYYYLDTMPTGHYLNLYDFVEENGTTHYKPAPLQNLMTFIPEVDNTNGKLVKTTATTESDAITEGATIKIGSDYYRPYNSSTDGSKDKYKVYAVVSVNSDSDGNLIPVSSSDEKFSSATIKYGDVYYRPIEANETVDTANRYSSDSFSNEKYYLSFFTTSYKTTEQYDIEIRSADSFADKADELDENDDPVWAVKNWRPNEIQTNGNKTVHLFIGDLYENDLELSVVPMKRSGITQLMGEDNYFLTVTMTACVKLKGNPTQQERTASNMRLATNSPIYQTFLMAYDKKDESSTEIGIDRDAEGSIMTDDGHYKIISGEYTADEMTSLIDGNNASLSDVDLEEYINDSASFIELRNNTNLLSKLSASSTRYAATLQVKYDMFYDSALLSEQFPMNQDPEKDDYGAKVKAYSKISSSKISAAYSSTSTNADDTTLYYTANDEKAKLDYDLKPTSADDEIKTPRIGNYGGKYSYGGINALEASSDDAEALIESIAVYDVRKVQNPGDYIELTFSLSQKGSYLEPTTGDPQPDGKGTALDIRQYMSEFIIYGNNGSVLYQMSNDTVFNSEASGTTNGGLNSTGKMITIRVNKSALKTRGGETSGIYEIPISYTVKTGNDNFDVGKNKYSNYMVSITAATYANYETATSGYTASSYAYNYLIYTNARLDPTVR